MPKRKRKLLAPTGMFKKLNIVIVVAVFIGALAFFGFLKLGAIDRRLPEPVLSETNNNKSDLPKEEQSRPVSLKNVSPYMVLALLAAEDHHFYEHNGVDPVGLARATADNLKAGHMIEGGSTITQQLVKNVFLDWRDRSALRKIKEWMLAWELERRYSKQAILESYLNCVYFGNGAYGIERAANIYFGVSARQLTIPQSAFLAALLKAPSDLGVASNEAQAFARQRLILQNMLQYGYITSDQERLAQIQALAVIPYGHIRHKPSGSLKRP
jgi:membrane peptidoglycan carboxypeptidase